MTRIVINPLTEFFTRNPAIAQRTQILMAFGRDDFGHSLISDDPDFPLMSMNVPNGDRVAISVD